MAQDDWQELLREASRLRVAGRVDEAIIAYQRLLKTNPDLPDSWYNLGWLQKHARQFEDASRSYERALDLHLSSPEEVHLNLAVIYSDHLFRPEDAERELNKALDENPNYVPALLNLGNLREDFGDRDGARAAYERALAVEPGNILALARLAGVSHAPVLDADLAARLRQALSRSDTSPADCADLGFALGGLLDAAGQHDDAFAAIVDANAASRAGGAAEAHYDRKAHERFIDRLIGTFDRPVAAAPPGESPLFICGIFRSGSTLVEQILARHSQVTAGGELEFIASIADQIPNYPEGIKAVDAGTIASWRDYYLGGLPARPGKGHFVTDKRPDNFLHIGLIKMLFPAAKVIHTLRNPLDNLLSLYFLHLNSSMAYALDLEDCAHWYAQYSRLMAHWKGLYPADIIDVNYDELVRDPQPVIAHLLRSCGLPWQDQLLDFHHNRLPVKTASVWQVREPLHARSSGRSRNYRRHLKSIRPLLPGNG